jgi:hypothetical protein
MAWQTVFAPQLVSLQGNWYRPKSNLEVDGTARKIPEQNILRITTSPPVTPCFDGGRYISYYHIVVVVAKKVAISVTIDGDILLGFDAVLREIQQKELQGKKPLSNRSSLIEQVLADFVRRQGRDR